MLIVEHLVSVLVHLALISTHINMNFSLFDNKFCTCNVSLNIFNSNFNTHNMYLSSSDINFSPFNRFDYEISPEVQCQLHNEGCDHIPKGISIAV